MSDMKAKAENLKKKMASTSKSSESGSSSSSGSDVPSSTGKADKLRTYATSLGTSGLIEASRKLSTIIDEISRNSALGEIQVYIQLVKGIKRVPLAKDERDNRYKEYFKDDASKATVPAKDWLACSKILDSVNEKLEGSQYLSAAALVMALENDCNGMCEEGLSHPEIHGWFAMAKGPYHFVNYAFAVDATFPLLSNTLLIFNELLASGISLKDLVNFDPNARPTRTATKGLEEIKNIGSVPNDKLREAFAVNPTFWRFARDIRQKEAGGKKDDKDVIDCYAMIYTLCDAILIIGAQLNSPGLANYKPKVDPPTPPIKQMFGRVAQVLADFQFVIGYLKSPNGLGAAKRGVKGNDEFAYAQYLGMENSIAKNKKIQLPGTGGKSVADALFTGYKFSVTVEEGKVVYKSVSPKVEVKEDKKEETKK